MYHCPMSEAIAFDTHRYVKRLTECGFTEKQAETLADGQVALLNTNLATKADVAKIKAEIAKVEAGVEVFRQETHAGVEAFRQETHAGIEALRQETKADIEALRQETKADIEALRQETKAGIEVLRQETKADIAALKADLIKWMFGGVLGGMVAMTGLFAAIVRLMVPGG